MSDPISIKPDKTAFLSMAVLNLIKLTFILGFVVLIIAAIVNGIAADTCNNGQCQGIEAALLNICPGIAGLFSLILIVINALNLFVIYRKEEYTITKDRITIKRGGIFSDQKTELAVKNITFVDLELPFIEHLLFKTGKISITSAGTGLTTSIVLYSLIAFDKVYADLISAMRANGFRLKKDELRMEARPDTIGIILNIIRKTGGFASFLFFAYLILNGVLIGLSQSFIWPLLTLLLFLLLYSCAVIIRFLDLKKRRYQVYSDCVYYNKGFLTKHKAFIPVENLSDSNTTQTFLQKIFGVYDIEVSSKGIASEIKFKNLTPGEALEEAIDTTVIEHQKGIHKIPEISAEDKLQEGSKGINKDEQLWKPSAFTTSLKMNIKVAFINQIITLIFSGAIISIVLVAGAFGSIEDLIGLLFYGFFFLIGFLVSVAKKIFEIIFTTYRISENSIKEEYRFLTTKNKEFNLQKITAVIVIRTLFDRLLGTCSIKFISIGSSQDITFHFINHDPILINEIKHKLGFETNEQSLDVIAPKFSITKMLLKDSVGYLILGLISIFVLALGFILSTFINEIDPIAFASITIAIWALILLLGLIRAIYDTFYYKQSTLTLYKDKLILKQGLLNISESHARFDNIKELKATKWPLTTSGSLQIIIAGDQIPQEQKNGQNSTNNYKLQQFDNRLTINYLPGVHNLAELLERFFQDKIDTKNYDRGMELEKCTQEVLYTTRPSLANDLTGLIFVSIFIWPLFLLIPFSIWEIKKREYLLEKDRVVERKGIINITKTSLLYSKIDNMNVLQGLFHKVFKNGSITLETAGSLMPEMVISNINDYQSVYEMIKEKYTKSV